jgi:hypothetical protein
MFAEMDTTTIEIVILAVFTLILFGIWFLLGYPEALKAKVEHPEWVAGAPTGLCEGLDDEDVKTICMLEEALGRELTHEEMRRYWDLREEGHSPKIIYQWLLEEIKEHKTHH